MRGILQQIRTLARMRTVALCAATVALGACQNASVQVTVLDKNTQHPVPARISVYLKSNGAAYPVDPTSSGPGTYAASNEFDMAEGTGTLVIDAAVYDIYATAGPEWTIDIAKAVELSGVDGTLTFEIEKVVDTSGYISGDFHIHSYASFDGTPPVEDRVINYVVEGVEVMGAADHDCLTDYGPSIAALGLASKITSIYGVEASPGLVVSAPGTDRSCRGISPGSPSSEPGHWSAFPLDPDVVYDSALDEAVNAATLYDSLRALQPTPMVIQLNHPHFDIASLKIDWFEADNKNFRPALPVPPDYSDPSAPNAFLREPSEVPGSTTQGIDFDLIEVIAHGQSRDWLQNAIDWYSLLNQGLYKVGMANSDSHDITKRTAGYPRTYFKVPDDSPTSMTPALIRDSLLAGNVLGTTGPFLEFEIAGAGIGQMTTVTTGTVDVAIKVQAAPWIEVGEVRVVQNGTVIWSMALAPQDPEPVVRFEDTVTLPISEDSWFSLGAGSPLPPDVVTPMYVPPLFAKVVRPNIPPIAFTNPVFVDNDGDGQFTAPGL